MIDTRPARDDDRARCIWIEDGAIQGLRYIDDVWPLFTTAGDGDLTLAGEGDTVGGMGKLTHLFGRFCWLESLRVHPEYQNRGLGKAIYRRYLAEMAERGLTSCGMYTGLDNTHSRHLAELFGLRLAGRFDEYHCPTAPPTSPPGFAQISDPAEGEALLAPLYPLMSGFLTVNRTWLPAAPGLGAEAARRGWLYACEGTLLVAGARFQPHKALHAAFIYGDTAAALAFAHTLAARAGSAGLTAIRAYGADTSPLLAAGFARTPHSLITLWKDL